MRRQFLRFDQQQRWNNCSGQLRTLRNYEHLPGLYYCGCFAHRYAGWSTFTVSAKNAHLKENTVFVKPVNQSVMGYLFISFSISTRTPTALKVKTHKYPINSWNSITSRIISIFVRLYGTTQWTLVLTNKNPLNNKPPITICSSSYLSFVAILFD